MKNDPIPVKERFIILFVTLFFGGVAFGSGYLLVRLISGFVSGFPENLVRHSSWPIYVIEWFLGIIFVLGVILGPLLYLVYIGIMMATSGIFQLFGREVKKVDLKKPLKLLRRKKESKHLEINVLNIVPNYSGKE